MGGGGVRRVGNFCGFSWASRCAGGMNSAVREEVRFGLGFGDSSGWLWAAQNHPAYRTDTVMPTSAPIPKQIAMQGRGRSWRRWPSSESIRPRQ